jgi:hypothetical protein
MKTQEQESTSRELYREPSEGIGLDYYANSIGVNGNGTIYMSVGGLNVSKTIEEWHKLALPEKEKAKIAKSIRESK